MGSAGPVVTGVSPAQSPICPSEMWLTASASTGSTSSATAATQPCRCRCRQTITASSNNIAINPYSDSVGMSVGTGGGATPGIITLGAVPWMRNSVPPPLTASTVRSTICPGVTPSAASGASASTTSAPFKPRFSPTGIPAGSVVTGAKICVAALHGATVAVVTVSGDAVWSICRSSRTSMPLIGSAPGR